MLARLHPARPPPSLFFSFSSIHTGQWWNRPNCFRHFFVIWKITEGNHFIFIRWPNPIFRRTEIAKLSTIRAPRSPIVIDFWFVFLLNISNSDEPCQLIFFTCHLINSHDAENEHPRTCIFSTTLMWLPSPRWLRVAKEDLSRYKSHGCCCCCLHPSFFFLLLLVHLGHPLCIPDGKVLLWHSNKSRQRCHSCVSTSLITQGNGV